MRSWWLVGWVLIGILVLAALMWLRTTARARRGRPGDRDAPVDLALDVPETPPRETKWRRGEFVDDTAPAVLSVAPELDRPEWDRNKRG